MSERPKMQIDTIDETRWRKIKNHEFPRPLKVSEAITAWRVSEVRAWLVDPQNYGGNHG